MMKIISRIKKSLIICLSVLILITTTNTIVFNHAVYATTDEEWNELSSILYGIKGVYNSPPGNVAIDVGVPNGPLLGNGDIGVAIGGDNKSQTFHIGKSDLWYSKPTNGDTGRASAITLGKIDLSMNNGGSSISVQEQQVQDILNAEVRSKLNSNGVNVNLRTWLAESEDLMVIEMTTDSVSPVAMHLETSVPANALHPYSAGIDADKMWNARQAYSDTNSLWTAAAGFSTRILGTTASYSVVGNNTVIADFNLTYANPLKLVVSVKGGKYSTDHVAQAKTSVGQITDTVLTNLENEHKNWWKDYWLKSYVKLSDSLLEKYYYGSLYILGSASRQGSIAAGMYGPWVTTDSPGWSNDYHLNYNEEATYFGVYSSNRQDLAMPYYTAIRDYMTKGRQNALTLVNPQTQVPLTKGLYYPVGLGPWGSETEMLYFNQKGNSSFAAMPFIWHYYYTHDVDFMQNIAYPYLTEAADFWEQYLVLENGRYNVLNSALYEGWNNKNSIVDLSFIRALFKCLLDASVEMNVDSSRRALWNDILTNLSDYSTKIQSTTGERGYRGAEDFINSGPCGALELYPVFPAENIGLNSNEKDLKLAYDSGNGLMQSALYNSWILRRFTEVYSQAIKVGYSPSAVIGNMKYVIDKEMMNNLLCDEKSVGGIETVAGIEAIDSMLMQSTLGVIRLFPAWLSDKQASFKRLRAQGAFLVSAEYSGGQVQNVSILSEKGKSCTFLNPWTDKTVKVYDQNSNEVTATLSNGKYTFATQSGYTYTLVPQGFNKPVLAAGLTPVNWNGTQWVSTTENSWSYNYTSADKRWANAMTSNGSMFVWVPRYTYKINGSNNISLRFSQGINDDITGGYEKQPAFTFGPDEVEGIWVAKFEASNKGGENEGRIQSKPALQSYRVLHENDIYARCLEFDTQQGLSGNVDSHLMKNSEWGAVTYLSSAFGSLPATNGNTSYYTGGSDNAGTVWTQNINQSTCGNVYGIYDMNGGAWDMVSSYIAGANQNCPNIMNAQEKYKDVTGSSFQINPALRTTKGMALEETSTSGAGATCWDGSGSGYPTDISIPFFRRGGSAVFGSSGIYSYISHSGTGADDVGFRQTLVVYNHSDYTAAFKVANGTNPIYGASISINGNVLTTDLSGLTSIKLAKRQL